MHADFKTGQIPVFSLPANTNIPGPSTTFFRQMSQPDFQLVVMSSCQIFTHRFISFNHFSPSWGISTLPQLAWDFGGPLLNIVIGCIGTKKEPVQFLQAFWTCCKIAHSLPTGWPYSVPPLPKPNLTSWRSHQSYREAQASSESKNQFQRIEYTWVYRERYLTNHMVVRKDISPTTNFLSRKSQTISLSWTNHP